jgi:uncharacterized membrane protein YdjX (TVP38/TMEM64 family)
MMGKIVGVILLLCLTAGGICLAFLLLRKYLRRARRMFQKVSKEYGSMHEEVGDFAETPTQ